MSEKPSETSVGRRKNMRSRLQRITSGLGMAALCTYLLSCNQGEEGFNAETGSKVILPADASVTTNDDLFILATAAVTSSADLPANDIQIQLICTKCDLFDAASGVSEVIPDPSLLQQVTSP